MNLPFPPAVQAHFEEMAHRARVAEHMHDAIHRTIALAEQYANYTADLSVVPYKGDNITVLMHAIYTEAHRLATDAFYGTPPSLRLVIPLWLETASGGGFPDSGVITVPHTPPLAAQTVNVLALANRDRAPSLWLTDWQWVGVFPVTTPYYDPKRAAADVEARPCAGTCDEDDGQAAA